MSVPWGSGGGAGEKKAELEEKVEKEEKEVEETDVGGEGAAPRTGDERSGSYGPPFSPDHRGVLCKNLL